MIEHRRPDNVDIVDIAVPGDTTVQKEQEKVDKYQNLARELERLWKVNTNIIPTVVGALETTPKSLEKNLKRAGTTVSIELLQKAALLGTALIFGKVLDIG